MGNKKLSPSATRDVRTLIRLLQKAVGESDIQMLAALINEEADLRAGKTDLPMTCKLAHELTDLAERGLAVIETGREENETMKESILTASEEELGL